MAAKAKNTIADRNAGEVLRLVRNALAHGNLVYLNKRGHEEPGTKLEHIAFLSRYEEDEESRKFG